MHVYLLFSVDSDSPLPLSILSTALCGIFVIVAGDIIEGFPQELLSLWGGSWVINRCHISPCQPRFITIWLEFSHKHIHGNLHHIFTAWALKKVTRRLLFKWWMFLLLGNTVACTSIKLYIWTCMFTVLHAWHNLMYIRWGSLVFFKVVISQSSPKPLACRTQSIFL